MSSQYGELSQALNTLVKYLENKGQLPDLQNFIVIEILQTLINAYTDIKIYINWDKLVSLSINAPRQTYPPLWVDALEKLTKIGAQTQIITELSQRKKLEKVI
jgi:antitoxin component HigA of HigAB toxin-antitoxin module